MKITAIILTYNRPKALELILLSITKQKLKPFEVIVADDGSGRETLDVVSKLKKNFPVKLKHVWHEDKGFRIAAIRNKAIKASTGECIIFSDGDLIFHPYYFYDFKRNLQPGNALIGSRVFLNQKYSQQIQESSNFNDTISFLSNKIEKNRFNSIRLPAVSKLVPQSTFSDKLRGGLLAVWKKDIIAVNGWNEDFTGWGKEDTELIARLFFNSVRFKKLKFAGVSYHIWHSFESRSKVKTNEELLTKCIKQRSIWCENGLIKGDKS